MLATAIALFSALAVGSADFLLGAQTRRFQLLVVLVVSQLACAILLLGAALVWGGEFPTAVPGLAVAAAAVQMVALVALARGLAIGPMSLVAPITGMNAIVPLTFGVLTGDALEAVQAVGIAACMLGVIVVSRSLTSETAGVPIGGEPNAFAGLGLVFGVVAMLAIGAHVVVLGEYTEHASPFWVIANNTLISTLALLLVFLTVGSGLHPPVRARSLPLLEPTLMLLGLLQAVGVLALTLALDIGQLSIVGVVFSLYPVATVLLARLVLGERLTRSQMAGIVLLLGGILAISA